MTNETDLRECSAQIELVKQLLGPETFDLKKILIELETKKKLLMTFKPRSYAAILRDIEAGFLKHPGDWVLEEKKTISPEESKKILDVREAKAEQIRLAKEKKTPESEPITMVELEEDLEKAKLEKELQDTKDKLAELEALKELEKEEESEIIEEALKEL